MDYNHIRFLLDKYFEGNTTLEEEGQLADFFRQGHHLPDDLKAYTSWFVYLDKEREVKASSVTPLLVSQKQPKTYLVVLKTLSRVAAVLLIGFIGFRLLSTGLQEQKPEKTAAIDWSKYEPKNPEEAFRLTSKALKRTSIELNRGAVRAAEEVFRINQK